MGNFFLVVPYLMFVVAGVVFILIALRDRKGGGGSITNLTARRKHPLRHVQVEINRARKAAVEKARAGQDEAEKDEDKPKRKRRRGDGDGDGPRWLRRV